MHEEKKLVWLVIQVAGKSKQLGRCLARTLLAVSQHSREVERKMASCPMGVCESEEGRVQGRFGSFFWSNPFVSELTQSFENCINPFREWFSHYLIMSSGTTSPALLLH